MKQSVDKERQKWHNTAYIWNLKETKAKFQVQRMISLSEAEGGEGGQKKDLKVQILIYKINKSWRSNI